MKFLILVLFLILPAYSAEYLVKLDPNQTFKTLNVQRQFKLSFGTFAVINSEDKNFIQSVAEMPGVLYVEPNYIYTTLTSDPEFTRQWGLQNDGKNSGGWFSSGVAGMDINAIKAWNISKGAKTIKIAVIDSGVDYLHEDLKNNIMINEKEKIGRAGIDDDQNGFVDDIYGYDFSSNSPNPMDRLGHGTHCAGVIGAQHNSLGIAGVMANVQILPVKFLGDRGQGTLESAVRAIDYAIARGVQVMSNSWGATQNSQALYEAIQRAEKAGIIFIAAAGNSRANNDVRPSYPAGYKLSNLIAVGAIDGKGRMASFSNYGPQTVHVFAPGVNIYSTVPANKYKKMSGTSMACPHVSGIVGLILSKNPEMNAEEIRERLMTTSENLEDLRGKGLAGKVDAGEALK